MNLINPLNFYKKVDHKQVELFTLKNKNGLVSQITNYGGKVVSLWVPDKKGNFEDIVLGFNHIDDYQNATEKYFGAIIGRYGNRIAKGAFSLNGKKYQLVCNNGINHLHGGDQGFDAVVWKAQQIDEQSLELSYLSKHLEEGYPGNLTITVKYQLTDENELITEYWATTDQSTIINLTQHSFFNLKGAGNGSINQHLLQINADKYTPVDHTLIPTGEMASLENTAMDFRTSHPIDNHLNMVSKQLAHGKGYDHNFVLNQSGEDIHFAARVIEPKSGRVLEVLTNEPGLQFYGGNFLDGSIIGKQGKPYDHRSAFCLETQHFPDSPNHPHFPSTVLNPGDEYYSKCIYKLSTENL